MKFTTASKTFLGVCLLIAASFLSTILGFEARNHQIASREWVEHTYQVLNQIELVFSLVKDAETGQRGYLLTHDETYLLPFKEAKVRIKDQLAALQKLTVDNLETQLHIKELSIKIDERFAVMEKTIDIADHVSLEAAIKQVKTHQGKRLMDEIRKLVAVMMDTENRLLRMRIDLMEKNTAKATAFSVFFSCLSIGALMITAFLLHLFIKARQKAELTLSTQYLMVQTLNESTDLSEVTVGIQQVMNKMGDWCVAAFWVVDEDDKVIACASVSNSVELANSKFVNVTKTRKFVRGEGLPGRVWLDGRSAYINNVTTDPNFPRSEFALQAGLKSGFAFPIMSGDEVMGVVELFSKQLVEIDKDFLDMMTSMGMQVGQYIERRLLETDTLEQKRFLRLVMDTMSDGLIVANNLGNFVMSNPAAEELVGKLSDMPPEQWSESFGIYESEDGEQFPSEQLPLARAIRGESSADVELFVRSKAVPQGRWISVSGRPMRNETGDFDGGLVLFRDISDKKEAEKRVSEFYSTVSHELRTPLTSIRGSLGLIEGGLAGTVSEKTLRLVKIALNECDRLVRLINDILDLRKIEAGKLELKKSTVECAHLIERTIDGTRGMAQTNGIEVVSELNTGGPMLCDEDRIIQVLTNLVSNAIKFSPRDSVIRIVLDPGSGSTFKFSIIDKGAGIPANQMHKLFGKFQQIDQSDSRKKEGTGLGLAITKKIVEEHGGTIGVESELGEGSTFWFELPATFAPLSTKGKLQEFPAKYVHPALIVEDDDSIAEVLKMRLSAEGFEVIRASTIADANALLQEYKPLVILLDLGLPDGNGLDLLKRLNSDDERKDIPVIVITASLENGQTRLGFPALVDWISKPFDEERLRKALDSARQEILPAHVLLVEDDPATREILKHHLESLGVEYSEAADGATAISSFREHAPDLVILDLQIPPPDGFAVADILNKEGKNLTPIIVYSALDLSEDQKSKLQAGLTTYLLKGSTSDDKLIGTVREYLDGLLLKKPKLSSETSSETESEKG